ncbi:membrane transporter protein [Rutstroemia sp. NJR-2017a WRK4]|nr:membrane transporter protein [Rutstroemia sp. NJR-2017a WRK4]
MGDSESILTTFLGALQASLTVLLTISYGVLAARFNLLKESSAKDISNVCVKLFLPALLITNVGQELQPATAYRYVPVLRMDQADFATVWALFYTLSSMALGLALKRMFKFPSWAVPAICFNNTTALPLLLIQALDTAGILQTLTIGDDTSSAALRRAKSYFLVSSMVGNSLTFAIGPKLLGDAKSPDEEDGRRSDSDDEGDHDHPTNSEGRTADEQEQHSNETTTLLPHRVAQVEAATAHKVSDSFHAFPAPVQRYLGIASTFVNAPMIGAIIGAIVGLVPPFHRAFFDEPARGGVFKAWLTSSGENVGNLFAALQLVVVGAKLSGSLVKMKKGEASGTIKWNVTLTVFFIRFVMWPLVSIGAIYLVAQKTNWLINDPILWFVLMLLPTGPPATKLTSLADVSGAGEEEKMSIAKFVTATYAVSPVICFAVVGSLKACEAIL